MISNNHHISVGQGSLSGRAQTKSNVYALDTLGKLHFSLPVTGKDVLWLLKRVAE
jgi:hypothetical protein